MKLKHCLIIQKAIKEWLSTNPKLTSLARGKTIVCLASVFNWEVFMAAKVEGDTISFMARELYPYLTRDHIMVALMKMTNIDGGRKV